MPRHPETEKFELDRLSALERIREDVVFVMESDPAARSWLEVLICYPGLHALWFHRLAFALWWREFRLTARIISHVARFLTGIEIHPGARIGRRVFIDHGMGVVIGETAVIEDDVLIYKGVLLGGVSREKTIRHPWIGKGVVIGSNACILGAIVVGEGARIGSGSIVLKDVPAGATVVGVPGRAVERRKAAEQLAHADLPDPVARALDALLVKVNESNHRLAALEKVVNPGETSPPPADLPGDIEKLFSESDIHQDGSGI
jgi:serine O-acetyltransferase